MPCRTVLPAVSLRGAEALHSPWPSWSPGWGAPDPRSPREILPRHLPQHTLHVHAPTRVHSHHTSISARPLLQAPLTCTHVCTHVHPSLVTHTHCCRAELVSGWMKSSTSKQGTAGALDKCKQNLSFKPLVVTGACISSCYFLMTCFTTCRLGPDSEKRNYAKKSPFCVM